MSPCSLLVIWTGTDGSYLFCWFETGREEVAVIWVHSWEIYHVYTRKSTNGGIYIHEHRTMETDI